MTGVGRLTLVLASASPRRRILLEQLDLDFEVRTADLDEAPRPRESAGQCQS